MQVTPLLRKVPHATVILAMSADGKIADATRAPARFGSAIDKLHLEAQISQADAVLFGAGTLWAYGTTLKVTQADLLNQRQQQGKPLQPVQIVCSGSAKLDAEARFFSQPVPRWLLTTTIGARWHPDKFERVLVAESKEDASKINWQEAFEQLYALSLEHLAVLGGGELVASLFAADLVDELWLTVCPLILGGAMAPTPVEGVGFLAGVAPRLELLDVRPADEEVFLHYRVKRKPLTSTNEREWGDRT
ncbi:MAG: RibD family protein [Candidatus Parcubacteria bacterium]|uniref:RibD family protein n=1 Tax=Phormidesmis priestleyi TaxID=268141 RepID=UPI000A700D52|nr:RibD family protein [Phormidesmis priestleyi]MBC7822811.1 RibD family protein [Leptolyngbyaceae cyanobacterium LF-bin-113]